MAKLFGTVWQPVATIANTTSFRNNPLTLYQFNTPQR